MADESQNERGNEWHSEDRPTNSDVDTGESSSRSEQHRSSSRSRRGADVAELLRSSSSEPSRTRSTRRRRTRRKVNSKAILVVAGALVLIAGGVHLLHIMQVGRINDALRQQSLRAQTEGNSKQAIRYLRQYVARVAADVEAEVELVGLLEPNAKSFEQYQELFERYEAILRRDPDRDEIRRKVAELAIRFRRTRDALDHLSKLTVKHPEDIELQFLMAHCYELDTRFQDAIDQYRGIIAQDPHHIESYQGLGRIWRIHIPDPAAASQIYDDLVTANPESARAHLTRASYSQQQGDLETAVRDILIAGEKAPDDLDVLLMTAELMLEDAPLPVDKTQLVYKRLQALVESDSDDRRVYLALFRLHSKNGELDVAEKWLKHGVEKFPHDVDFAPRLVMLDLERGNVEVAERRIRTLKEHGGEAASVAKYLEAQLLLVGKNWTEAKERLLALRTEFPVGSYMDAEVKYSLAQCHAELKETNAAIDLYQSLLDRDPTSSRARIQMAIVLATADRTEEALDNFRFQADDPLVLPVLAPMLLTYIAKQPPQEQNWRELEDVLATWTRLVPNSMDRPVVQTQMYVLRGQPDDARKVLEEARAMFPQEIRFPMMLADLAARRQDAAAAEEILSRAKDDLGDRAELRLARIAIAGLLEGDAADEMMKPAGEDLESFSPAVQAQILTTVAESLQRNDKNEDALKARLLAAELLPKDAETHRRVVSAHLAVGNHKEARQAIEQLRKIEGEDGLHWRMAEIAAIAAEPDKVNSEQIEKARRLLSEAEAIRPDWTLLPVGRAQIAELAGEPDKAIVLYREGLSLGMQNSEVLKRLIVLLFQRERFAEAEAALEEFQSQRRGVLSGEIERLASLVSFRTGDKKRAFELAKRSVNLQTNDYRNHIWYGTQLADQGRNEEAEQEFRKALALDESRGGSWVILVQHLARNKRTSEALLAVELASRRVVPKERPVTLARCFEILGRRDLAEQNYLAALSVAPEDHGILSNVAMFFINSDQPARAEPLLRQLIDPESRPTTLELLWGRRQLARVLAADHLPGFRKGVELLEQNLQTEPNSIPDLSAKAELLAARPRLANIREAVRILKSLEARDELQPGDALRLSKLLDDLGDFSDADRRWTKLMEKQGDDSQIVSAYISRQLKRGNFNEATIWLNRLLLSDPNRLKTTQLAVEVFVQTGKLNAALNAVSTYVKDDTLNNGQWVRLLEAARLLDEQVTGNHGRDLTKDTRAQLTQAAESYYRQYAEHRPHDNLAFVSFLAKIGEVDEAVPLLVAAARGGEAAEVCRAASTLFVFGKPTETQTTAIEEAVTTSLAGTSSSVPSQLSLGELREMQGKFDEAVSVYRTVLQLDAENVDALNRLAFLLVWRNELEEAATLVKQLQELDGTTPASLITQAQLLQHKGQTDAAVAALKQAIAEEDTPACRFVLAWVYSESGNKAAARFNLREARKGGLQPEMLHPLLRQNCQALLDDMEN